MRSHLPLPPPLVGNVTDLRDLFLDCFIPYNYVIRKRLYFCVSTSPVRDSMLVEKRRSPLEQRAVRYAR